MHCRLVRALRSRGVPVITVLDAGLTEKCVLYTFNVSDFHRLHMKLAVAGQEHGGMTLAPQQRYSIGEQLRRILRLRATMTAAARRNRVEFLSNWG